VIRRLSRTTSRAAWRRFCARPPALFLPHAKAAERFFDFFTANIRNKNTRRAYYKAVCRFAEWSEAKGLRDLLAIKPFHIAAYIEGLGLSKPTVKQQLAALRMLFDRLVVGHVLEVNPAHAVREPKYSVKKGKTRTLGAVLQMNVSDYFVQGRRGWVCLHEKNGKEHEAPCHHKLEEYLDEYIGAAGIAGGKDAPLFRTSGRFTGFRTT
jgi:integrase/recombinase XerD